MALRLSRSKFQLLVECPRCFWLDVKAKIRRPQPYPYTLSVAIDGLLKKEFDTFRKKGIRHPLMVRYKIDAKLFPDVKKLSVWRDAFRGIEYTHPKYDLTMYGAVDDIFLFPDERLAIVDYKTSGSKEIVIYKDYQLQMDIYAYLLKENGYRVYDKAFFIFYKIDKDKGFNGRLPFNAEIKEIQINTSLVEPLIAKARDILSFSLPPESNKICKFCSWVSNIKKYVK